MLTKSQELKLLKLARKTIKYAFSGEIPKFSEELKREFSNKQGIFVTLHEKGKLRGCIGYPMPSLSLFKAIISASRSAAFQDPRFSPLKKDELDLIDLELSVLSVPEEIKITNYKEYLNKIIIGEDGLIIKFGVTSGLLLPQVATEYDWSPEEFLMHTCNKAGLHSEAWKEKDVKLYKFQAQVFSEKDFEE